MGFFRRFDENNSIKSFSVFTMIKLTTQRPTLVDSPPTLQDSCKTAQIRTYVQDGSAANICTYPAQDPRTVRTNFQENPCLMLVIETVIDVGKFQSATTANVLQPWQ